MKLIIHYHFLYMLTKCVSIESRVCRKEKQTNELNSQGDALFCAHLFAEDHLQQLTKNTSYSVGILCNTGKYNRRTGGEYKSFSPLLV